jgi:hypothetical protein
MPPPKPGIPFKPTIFGMLVITSFYNSQVIPTVAALLSHLPAADKMRRKFPLGSQFIPYMPTVIYYVSSFHQRLGESLAEIKAWRGHRRVRSFHASLEV